jgi:uncharacterized protein YlzI (FlbEa/FlbD family)
MGPGVEGGPVTGRSGGVELTDTEGRRHWVDPLTIERIWEIPESSLYGPKRIVYLRYGAQVHVRDSYADIVAAIEEARNPSPDVQEAT